MNYDTGTFESAHKWNVKGIFKLTNKSQDAAAQMLKHLSTIETCNVLRFLYDKQNGVYSSYMPLNTDDDGFETEIARDILRGDDCDPESDDSDHDEKHEFENRGFVVTPATQLSSTVQSEILKDLIETTGVRDDKEV